MWDVKEPTHYSKRVGHEVPGVVAVLSEWVQCCTAHLNIINRKCAIQMLYIIISIYRLYSFDNRCFCEKFLTMNKGRQGR